MMFGFIKKMFFGLLAGILSASNHTKCVSLRKQKCMTQPSLINLHPIYFNLHTIHLQLKLDRSVGSCSALNYLSNKVCACSKQNRRFKSKLVQHDYWNK